MDERVKKIEDMVSTAVVKAAMKSGRYYDLEDKPHFELLSLRALQSALDELNLLRTALEARYRNLTEEMRKEVGKMVDLQPRDVHCVEISWINKIAYVASDDEVMNELVDGGTKHGTA